MKKSVLKSDKTLNLIVFHLPQKPNLTVAQHNILVRLGQFQFEYGDFGGQLAMFLAHPHFGWTNQHENLFGAKF